MKGKQRWLREVGYTIAKQKRKCICCDKDILSDCTTGSLIEGVELISMATFGSVHDYGYNNFNVHQVAFAICDECYELKKGETPKKNEVASSSFLTPDLKISKKNLKTD